MTAINRQPLFAPDQVAKLLEQMFQVPLEDILRHTDEVEITLTSEGKVMHTFTYSCDDWFGDVRLVPTYNHRKEQL